MMFLKETAVTHFLDLLLSYFSITRDSHHCAGEMIPAMMEEVLREAIDPNVPEFVKKMKRAQERYSFLE